MDQLAGFVIDGFGSQEAAEREAAAWRQSGYSTEIEPMLSFGDQSFQLTVKSDQAGLSSPHAADAGTDSSEGAAAAINEDQVTWLAARLLPFIAESETASNEEYACGLLNAHKLSRMKIAEMTRAYSEMNVERDCPGAGFGQYHIAMRDVVQLSNARIAGQQYFDSRFQADLAFRMFKRATAAVKDSSDEDYANALASVWATLPAVTEITEPDRVVAKGASRHPNLLRGRALTSPDFFLATVREHRSACPFTPRS